jgi:hypothetical protein
LSLHASPSHCTVDVLLVRLRSYSTSFCDLRERRPFQLPIGHHALRTVLFGVPRLICGFCENVEEDTTIGAQYLYKRLLFCCPLAVFHCFYFELAITPRHSSRQLVDYIDMMTQHTVERNDQRLQREQEMAVVESMRDQEAASSPPQEETHPEAMVMMGTPSSSSSHEYKSVNRKKRFLLLGFVVLLFIVTVAVGIGVVLGSKNDTKQEPQVDDESTIWDSEQRMFDLTVMLNQVSDPVAFLDPKTPQSQALDWLVFEDLLLESALLDYNTTLQRYALIVLAFATNADIWRGTEAWYKFPDKHECTFVGVDCNADREVTGISLSNRKLTGRLPDEIALLTTLTSLDVSRNSLEGKIPASVFSKLTKLGTFLKFLVDKAARAAF